MFGINRLKEQIKELRKEIAVLNDSMMYYEYQYSPLPNHPPSDPFGLNGPQHSFMFSRGTLAHGKLLKARDVLARFDEIYEALNLERKTIPGAEATTKLEPKKP